LKVFSKKVSFWAAIILCTIIISEAYAKPENNYSVKANIIYRFTKYIDWPQNKKNGDFIIGIIGETPLYDELKIYTWNKKVGAQNIVVINFSSSASAYNCSILIITEDASPSLRRIAALTADAPILIVSENNSLARRGSCINFVVVNDHLKLEFNKNNIEQRKLKIASELLDLGTIIN